MEINKTLDFVKLDLEVIQMEGYDACHDLLNITLLEEVPKLIKFIEKVNSLFQKQFPIGSGQVYQGAKDEFESLKRQIYETK